MLYYVVKTRHSRGAKQEDEDFLHKFRNDELYRNFQIAIGWTEE